MGGDPAYWKRYRGGTAGKLWTASADDPLFTRVLAGLNGQLASPMLIGGRLFFLSDHEGTGNIYSCALDGTSIARHTDHDGMYARNPSTDGHRIVYHVAGDIWMLDGPDAPAPGSSTSPSAPRPRPAPPGSSPPSDHLGSLDCDQTGQASVVEVRGTVHWLTHRDGPARALHVDPDARARLPLVLGETGKVVWITDAVGPDALEVAAVAGEPRPVRLAEGLLGTVTSLAASPDGATVAAAANDGRLLAVDVASGQVTELAVSDDGPVNGLSWSPDSAWLAWSQPGPRPLSRIRLARIADHQVVDVTDGRFADTDPVFTADGLYLAFLSVRSFDPVYDAQSFDLSFPFGSRPYLVPLAAQTPSPFGPLPGGRPVSEDPSDADKSDSAERIVVSVDADGLPGRVVGVPVIEARYSGLRAVKDGLAWRREPVRGVLGESAADLDDDAPRPSLERYDLSKREVTELAEELDWFTVSGDGTRLVVCDRDELRVMPSEQQGRRPLLGRRRYRGPVPGPVPGRPGRAVAARLRRGRAGHAPELLGAGHVRRGLGRRAGVLPAAAGPDPRRERLHRPAVGGRRRAGHVARLHHQGRRGLLRVGRQGSAAVGQLGADLSRDPAGRWVVDRVLPGESSDPRARSPLAAPGVAVQPGDELVAVDGQPVDPVRGPWPLLAGAAGKPVELTVQPRPGRRARSSRYRCGMSGGCDTRTGWPATAA